LTAGFLILVAISAASLYLGHRARTDSLWVTHTVEVESQIGTVQLQIQRAENAVRGFLVTLDKGYRSDFEKAEALIGPSISRLQKLTQDNPIEQSNVAELDNLIKQRLEFLHRAVSNIENGQTDQARTSLMEISRNDEMDRLLDVGRNMRVEENRLFELRTEAADRSQSLNMLVTIAGSAFIVLLAVLSILLIRSSTRARDQAEANLRDINLNLESAVDERTGDLREANQEIQRFASLASRQHHGFHQRARRIARRYFQPHLTLQPRCKRSTTRSDFRRRHGRTHSRARRSEIVRGFFRSARIHQILDRKNGPPHQRDPQAHTRGAP
jgi:CHASE3 domain sensor protein